MQGARETEQSGAVAEEGVTEGAADQVRGVCGDVAAFVVAVQSQVLTQLQGLGVQNPKS